MSTAYTRCPHCRTVFGLEDEELAEAPRLMRCGNCLRPFPVREHLLDEIPVVPESVPDIAPPPPPAPPGHAGADTDPFVPAAEPDLPPSLAGEAAASPTSWGRRLLAAVLALVLLGLLGLQAALFHPVPTVDLFPRLAPAIEQLMPVRERLRVALGKEREAFRDLAEIRLVSRDVRSSPELPGGLLAQGVLVNRSPFAQPFPALELTLFDINGATLASRRFTPQEYLGRPDPGPMMPGRQQRFTLRLMAPALDAVSYEFTFH